MNDHLQVAASILGTSLMLVTGCNWEDEPAPISDEAGDEARHQSAIVGGTVETGYPNVGAFVLTPPEGESVTCTGTVIADGWVLSSARCLTGGAPAYVDFLTGSDTSDPDAAYPVAQVFPQPNFDAETDQNDIALAYVHGVAATSAPPYNCSSLSNSVVGTSVVKVGYGASSHDPLTGIGTKRRAALDISSVELSLLTLESPGIGPCEGDSGAPSFLDISGEERLVGVTSHTAQDCEGTSFDTRVDTFCAWIDATVADDAPAECELLADECGDDTCVPVAEDAAYCVPSDGAGVDAACDPDDTDWSDGLACADGLVCATVDVDAGACRPVCTDDADCADDEDCTTPVFGLDTVGACLPCTDADGDGFCEDVDCDDADADVNPDATEVCDDGIDNDCNGLVDDEDPACQSSGDAGPDAGADTGMQADAGSDAGSDTGGTDDDPAGSEGGCNCNSGGPTAPAAPALVVLVGLLALRRWRTQS
ncbi:MAG: S1 family peptidase [Myxococcota bacterium]